MLSRFKDAAGSANLLDAMVHQRTVGHSAVAAEKLIKAGTLIEYQPGAVILAQDSADQSVFYILAGEVDVFVQSRLIGSRVATEAVGEMAAIDAAAPRSATVRAKRPTVCLQVSAPDFLAVANEFPAVWIAVAQVLGERIRQRRKFHRPPNPRPVLFIGSSVEGREIAKYIQLGLQHEPVEVRVWTDGVFGPGGVAVDKLIEQADQADFAAFVFGPDDTITSREDKMQGPRDNVVFEMGMFISQLGRERAYIVRDSKTELKIPSDLLGVLPLTYVANPHTKLEVTLGPVCTRLMAQVKSLGTC